MTNGEKFVKTFPDLARVELYRKNDYGIRIEFEPIWWDAEYKEPNKSENPTSFDNLSSGTRKKLEKVSPIIDWNNCHTSDKFDSIATAGFMHYFTEVWADGFIKALEQELKWIPVSERLPEDHKDVLVYLSSDRMSICRYNSHKLPFSNNPIGWGYMPGIGYIDFEKEHVMAWMSLPKAYKEVEE